MADENLTAGWQKIGILSIHGYGLLPIKLLIGTN
jgi:hypothetical protein